MPKESSHEPTLYRLLTIQQSKAVIFWYIVFTICCSSLSPLEHPKHEALILIPFCCVQQKKAKHIPQVVLLCCVQNDAANNINSKTLHFRRPKAREHICSRGLFQAVIFLFTNGLKVHCTAFGVLRNGSQQEKKRHPKCRRRFQVLRKPNKRHHLPLV